MENKFVKITLTVICSILALFLLVFGGLNLLKFAIFSDYYSVKSDVCINPGLSDGFVCQGICYYEEGEKFFVSGYMTGDSASRIYVTDKNNESYFVELQEENKKFTGHAGGIAVHLDNVYISSDSKIHVIPLSSLLSASNGDAVKITEQIPVNNKASFIYSDQNFLYVGEFYDGEKYKTEHSFSSLGVEHNAIVSRYLFENLTSPDKIYTLPNKVQGICFYDGKVILSTSYGLSNSVYYVYNENDAKDLNYTLDGAPVFALDNCINEVQGPAMAEGLDYYDGKVITLTESASNKYIFGKFFFADKIVALDILN